MARLPWNQLKPDYQKRLLRKGIGPREHAGGASIKDGRGHKNTPERNVWRRKAIAADIKTQIKNFDKLPAAEAETIGRQWVLGFMSKSKGPLESIRITDWRYGRRDAPSKVRYQTDEQINARQDLIGWINAHPEALDEGEIDWKKYRDAYMTSFSS